MDNINKIFLQKQLEFYSRLLEKHEATEKEKQQSTVENLSHNSNRKQISFHGHNVVQMKTQPLISFDNKYSFRKSNNFENCDHNKRTVAYKQNHNFKSKYALAKNQTSKYVSSNNRNVFKSNNLSDNLLSIPKKSVSISQNESDKSPCISSNKLVEKLPSSTKDFIKEIESVTELLKKKSSGNQPKEQSSVLNKPLAHKNSKYSAFNNFNPMKNQSIFSESKNSSRMSVKVKPCNIKSEGSRKPNNCYTKINSNNRINPSLLKKINSSKFSFKDVDNKEIVNSKSMSAFLKANKNANHPETSQKFISESHSRKITFSDSKSISNKLHLSDNASEFSSKHLSPKNQELLIKFTNESALSGNRASAESVNITKVKSQSFLKNKSPITPKSVKYAKLKPMGARYTKINKHLTTPHKVQRLKLSVHHQTPSLKKTRGKVNNKYKVINKILVPHPNKKANSFKSSKCRGNSDVELESDQFLREMNDSAIDKFEKNLLAISTALTSTAVSEECDVTNGAFQHQLSGGNTKLHFRKATLKKSKTRISKYKIINSDVSHNYSLKKRQNATYQRTGMKKLKQSKFSLINKHIQPVHVMTPVRHEKPILVRRIFKSKNVIVNKNASPTSYSAKMIKSKYLTLNKRRSPDLQKHIYPRMSLHHPKFKGSSLVTKHSKLNRYQRTAISTYHPKVNRKFTRYAYQTSNRQFSKTIHGKKYKKKSNGGYVQYPVVLIRGMKYSLNSSGKTLKKLHTKGSTSKAFRRISNKVFIRSPESSLKTLTPMSTNLASRVLHRSINRILTASSKKSLAKVNTYCMFYNRFGRCNRGVKCTYIHDPSKIAVCTRFLRGTCKVDGCPFSHEIAPGKMAICSFFLVGACEKVDCPYRHEKLPQDAKLCKAFVQGYCPNGKECKKAHILVCPKYMQSECDKGSSCPFPHPPQKVKKNVQKEAEVEERKPTDDFFENYLRYFQQGEECAENKSDENNPANLCVPKKRKKLEEQPSFIPL